MFSSPDLSNSHNAAHTGYWKRLGRALSLLTTRDVYEQDNVNLQGLSPFMTPFTMQLALPS